jgi:hypothetical protein
MSKFEENANTEILNPSADAVAGVAQDEELKAKNDEPDRLMTYQYEKLALANERLEDENERLRDVHELRKEYIPRLFGLYLCLADCRNRLFMEGRRRTRLLSL